MIPDFHEAYDLEWAEEEAWREELAREAMAEEMALMPFLVLTDEPGTDEEPPLWMQDDPSDKQLVGVR